MEPTWIVLPVCSITPSKITTISYLHISYLLLIIDDDFHTDLFHHFLCIMIQYMSIFLSFWKLWFRKYFPPLFQEVSCAHPIERALLIDLVHEGGGPDEEDLILLALRIGANLGWSSLSKSGMWSCTDQRFFARKVYIQSGRATSTESGIRALEGLVSWTYHRQSVLSAAQGEVPTFSPAETSGQEKNCTCWKLERRMPEQESTNEKQIPLLSREDIPSSYQTPRTQHFKTSKIVILGRHQIPFTL